MASYQAIAGVTETLKALLEDRMTASFGITFMPPDLKPSDQTGARLNLYLYHIAENAALKYQSFPGQGLAGRPGQSPLSLTLQYLLTAYPADETNSDGDLDAQDGLADAMTVLNDLPILTRNLYKRKTPGERILASGLTDELEQIKITLLPLSLDELSKIWTALPGANFRRSAAYEVSAVQLESRLVQRVSLPVTTRRLQITQSRRPEIQAVYRLPSPGEPTGDPRARIGDQIVIEGHHFDTHATWVRLGHLEPIGLRPDTDGRIRITIPDTHYPADLEHPQPREIPVPERLWPGPQRVEVLVEREMEVTAGGLEPHPVRSLERQRLASNQGVFLLVPTISAVPSLVSLASPMVSIEGRRLSTHQLEASDPTFTQHATAQALVGDISIPVRGPQQTEHEIQVSLTDPDTGSPLLPPGAYPVRVMVNGAQSLDEHLLEVVP